MNSRSYSQFKQNYEYNLKGVVIHMGVADSGHYYSIIKDSEDEGKQTWLEFNDDKVRDFDIKNLSNVAFGSKDGHSYQNAYILVYEKKDIKAEIERFNKSFDAHENEMVAESSIPEHIQEERQAFAEVIDEIIQKNKRLFYTSIVFSHEFMNIIQSITHQGEHFACSH
mmetsp:Transcript_7112/g.6382  ORF Transcript_7112/g.6382 Transcript_7112/m.6382 type:complete len:168 (+) Transcript_7112:5497-6000(+)